MVNLKLRVLAPLIGLYLIVFSLIMLSTIYHEHADLDSELTQKASAVRYYYDISMEQRAEKMLGISDLLVTHENLQKALLDKDQTQLLHLSSDLFERLKHVYNITHFYFHDTNGINILRMHQTARYGDTINRYTMRQAIKSGNSTFGVELGPLGTLTLRTVTPVKIDNDIVGFIELGEDIEYLLEELYSAIGAHIILTIDKDLLSKTAWNEGMGVIERSFDWNTYNQEVIVSTSISNIPGYTVLNRDNARESTVINLLMASGKTLYMTAFELKDAGQREIGSLKILLDSGARLSDTYARLFQTIIIAVHIGIVFFLSIYWVLSKTEKTLKNNQNELIKNQTQLKTAQQLAKISSWELDPNSNSLVCSKELCQLLGYKTHAIPSLEKFRSLIFPDDQSTFDSFINNVLSGGETQETEVRIVRSNGEIRFSRQMAERRLTDTGSNRINCVVQEITEEKQAQLLKIGMGHILESSWFEIFIFDPKDLHILQMSQGARMKLGISSKHISENCFLDFIPDMSRADFDKLVEPIHQGHKNFINLEGELKSNSDKCYPVEMRIQQSNTDRGTVYLAIGKDISERKQHVKELIERAFHDELTKLPNRRLLRDRLTQALSLARRQETNVALFIIDILGLSEINDILGHKYGDAIIKKTANRLQRSFRDSDTLARIGGDEFALVTLGVNRQNIDGLVNKISSIMQDPIIIYDTTIGVDVTIGISIAPDHGDLSNDLMRHADFAMRLAKSEKLEYGVYSSSVDPYDRRHIELYSELRTAVKEKSLTLYYQPKIDLKTGKIVSVEALARWPHPQEGLISPAVFVPMVEKSGLIAPFSKWVLEQAISDCAQWRREGIEVSIAANLSSRNLLDDDLPEYVSLLLKQYQLPENKLTIEITESAVMANPEKSISTLMQLHEKGIKLSIDDFGTGYSSLSYIKQFPVKELKVDSSFVFKMTEDESDALIVKSTIELAHSLGLTVIAEGVESEDVLDLLMLYGCDIGQGFLFGRPMPLEDFKHWTTQSKWGV